MSIKSLANPEAAGAARVKGLPVIGSAEKGGES